MNTISPLYLEFTEIYLDERAFMDHAASRQYLDGYAKIMNPAAFYRVPKTYRFGTPTQNLIDTILEPVLKDTPVSMVSNGKLFDKNVVASTVVSDSGHHDGNAVPFTQSVFMSFDIQSDKPDEIANLFSPTFVECCTFFVSFLHPLSADGSVTRIMCIVHLSACDIWRSSLRNSLNLMRTVRAEVTCQWHGYEEDSKFLAITTELQGLVGQLFISDPKYTVGYVSHPKSPLLQEMN